MKLFPKAGQLTKSPVERRMKYILIITDRAQSGAALGISYSWRVMLQMIMFRKTFHPYQGQNHRFIFEQNAQANN